MSKINALMDISNIKVGFNPHRLKENDPYYSLECAYVKKINKELKHNSSFLAQIVNHCEHKGYLEEEQEKIVMSVIQWLGTPVGQNFIKINNTEE
jgi:hypothetical protein